MQSRQTPVMSCDPTVGSLWKKFARCYIYSKRRVKNTLKLRKALLTQPVQLQDIIPNWTYRWYWSLPAIVIYQKSDCLKKNSCKIVKESNKDLSTNENFPCNYTTVCQLKNLSIEVFSKMCVLCMYWWIFPRVISRLKILIKNCRLPLPIDLNTKRWWSNKQFQQISEFTTLLTC